MSNIQPLLKHFNKVNYCAKDTVCCTVSSFGPTANNQTATVVTPAHHVDLIQAFSIQVNSISASPREHTISTRPGKYAYNHKLKAVNQLFPNYLTSRDVDISWPVWLLDLPACDFLCWCVGLTEHSLCSLTTKYFKTVVENS